MPDSVQDYLSNSAVQRAVDHLLLQKSSALPSEFVEWEEVRNYHRACLSAAQVRAEFAIYLMDAWQSIWAPVIQSFHPAAHLLSPREQADRGYDPQSPQAVWDDGTHRRTFRISALPHVTIDTGVTLEPEGLSLSFGCWDQTDGTELSDSLGLPDFAWLATPEEGWRRSLKVRGPEISQLKLAADAAMSQLAALARP